MTDDYQTQLDALGKELSEQSGTTEPEATSTPEPEDTSIEADTNTDTAKEEATSSPEETIRNQKANEAFAQMRSENSKYKAFMQHMMKGANFAGSEEDFIAQMTDASYAQQAKNQGTGISPELLKRMDTIEQQNKDLIEERNRTAFAANMRNLQDRFKLNDNEMKEFVELAVKEHIDLTIPGTNFVTLYQGLFYDKLIEKQLKDARQDWIAQSSKSNNAASLDGKSGKKDTPSTDINSMAEFESLLQSISK